MALTNSQEWSGMKGKLQIFRTLGNRTTDATARPG
jgi:hypothetical protein